jgi:hypothetical protein
MRFTFGRLPIENLQPSDTPGSIFAIFKIDNRFFQIVDSMTKTQKMDVVFNRAAGGLCAATERAGDGNRPRVRNVHVGASDAK